MSDNVIINLNMRIDRDKFIESVEGNTEQMKDIFKEAAKLSIQAVTDYMIFQRKSMEV